MAANRVGKIFTNPTSDRGSKIQMTADVGEDAKKEAHFSTVGGVVNWYNHSGNQSGDSSDNWTWYYLKTEFFHFWEYTPEKLQHTTKKHASQCS